MLNVSSIRNRCLSSWASAFLLLTTSLIFLTSCSGRQRTNKENALSIAQDSVYFLPPILEDFPKYSVPVPGDDVIDESLSGRWHARYRDATGAVYDILFSLAQSGDSVVGDASVSSWIAHNSVPAGSFRVFGSTDGSRITFNIEPNQSSQSIDLFFSGSIAPFQSRRQRCMYGIVDSTGSSRFLGGVWIAFRE